MKLLVDEQLSPAIAEELRRRGWDAQAIRNERPDLEGAPDDRVMDVAHAEGRVVVTNNVRDYRPFAADRLARGHGHSGLILVPATRPRTKAAAHGIARDVDVLLREGGQGLRDSERWLLGG